MKIREDQVTVNLVGKVFRLLPYSILLSTDDGEIICPDDEGKFNNLLPFMSLESVFQILRGNLLILYLINIPH